ncbi:sulfite exporter TauE/SafE family protein, partial [Candidatus Woesearchaeota archaeon]|nr:sulfite exporter TauE/SafE family protein [Candidatus Woesearchaeota archaeon]
MKKINLSIKGMHCKSCESLLKTKIEEIKGVKEFSADHTTGKGYVKLSSPKAKISNIIRKIEEAGYSCQAPENSSKGRKADDKFKWVNYMLILTGIIIAGYFVLKLTEFIPLPEINQSLGYGLLFLVGLLTGFHCIAMCGGFIVSYTAKNAQEGKKSHFSHVAYGAGKLISYTVIGAAFGLLGSIIAFTPQIRGVIGIFAGVFLVIFGVSMLGFFPFLNRFRLSTPKFLNRVLGKKSSNSGPLVIGLLNGLMIACGPLQAIYIMAAGTGSIIEGARLLFIFGLGTLPVMLGFGYFATFVSSKLTHKILRASGVVVIILGL